MKEYQNRVEKFIEENNLKATTPFRILDLVSEIGEIVKDVTKSADYGMKEEELEVKKDEIGDAFFSLFAVASDLGIEAEDAFEEAMEKYEKRVEEKGDPGSR